MLFPTTSLWYLWCLLKMDPGLWKNQDIKQSVVTLSCPSATLHCRTTYLCRSIWTSSITSLFAHLHAILHSPAPKPDFPAWFIPAVPLGCRKSPGASGFQSFPRFSAPFESVLKGSELCHTGVLGKHGTEHAAEQSCSSFQGDRGGEICWCRIQHTGWSWFRSTLQTSSPKPNSPWPSLFHGVDSYPLARWKNRETPVNVHRHKQSRVKKQRVHMRGRAIPCFMEHFIAFPDGNRLMLLCLLAWSTFITRLLRVLSPILRESFFSRFTILRSLY